MFFAFAFGQSIFKGVLGGNRHIYTYRLAQRLRHTSNFKECSPHEQPCPVEIAQEVVYQLIRLYLAADFSDLSYMVKKGILQTTGRGIYQVSPQSQPQ